VSIINLFKAESKALIAFAKKPIYEYQEQSFNSNLKRFGLVLFIDILLLIIVTILFYVLTFWGLDEIFKTNKNSELFNEYSLTLISFLIIIIVPLIEELIFRFYLKYRAWVINLIFPLIIMGLSFYLLSTIIAIITIVIFFVLLVVFNQKITFYLKQFWDRKFNIIFYISVVLFAIMHVFNYNISVSVILLAPLLVLPQFIGGILIGYLRVKAGFIWGVALHMASNAVLTLPIIISLSMAFPSKSINNKEYDLDIKKIEMTQKYNLSSTFSKDSILIKNYNFKACLGLLLDKEEGFIEFDDSFMTMGLPQIKAGMLLDIVYKNKSSEIESASSILTSKQNILRELQKAYNFSLDTKKEENEDIEIVKVTFQ